MVGSSVGKAGPAGGTAGHWNPSSRGVLLERGFLVRAPDGLGRPLRDVRQATVDAHLVVRQALGRGGNDGRCALGDVRQVAVDQVLVIRQPRGERGHGKDGEGYSGYGAFHGFVSFSVGLDATGRSMKLPNLGIN